MKPPRNAALSSVTRALGAGSKPDAMYDRGMKLRIYVDTSVIGDCEDD